MHRSGKRDGRAFAEVQVVGDGLNRSDSTGTTLNQDGARDIQSRTANGAEGDDSSAATASGTTTSP